MGKAIHRQANGLVFGRGAVNPDSIKYALRRLSRLKLADVTQRLRLRIRHQKLERLFGHNREAFSLSTMVDNRKQWLEPGCRPSDIRQSLRKSCFNRLGCLNLWSPDIWSSFRKGYPAHCERLIESGHRLLKGKGSIFGHLEVDIHEGIDWFSGFESEFPRERWPEDFYWKIDFADRSENRQRDIKLNWEINRLQFLLTLGACWRLTGDEAYSRTSVSILHGWMDQVRYPIGPHWSSNLEVALRTLSLIRTCLMFLGSDDWDDEFLLKITALIELHVDHLEHELTVHHTEGNHLLGESSALLQVSLLCPFLSRSGKRIRKASSILTRLIPRLILDDGVYAEQSASYSRFALEFLIPLIASKDSTPLMLSKHSKELIGACFYYLLELSDANGMCPMIGDSDSGSALGFYLDDYWNFSFLLACGAYIFEDQALLSKVREFPAESFLIIGPDGPDWYEANRLKPDGPVQVLNHSEPRIRRFRDGGLQTAEHGVFRTIFDVGPLGKAPGYEHGHSDGLSIQVWINDHPFLVDPGSFVYNGNQAWRMYFKGSSAHNTLKINDHDQSQPLGSFRWAYSPEILGTDTFKNKECFFLKASIALSGALWTRHIFGLHGKTLLVLDELGCNDGGFVDLNLIFHPTWGIDVPASLKHDSSGNWTDLKLFGWDEPSVMLLYGDEDTMGGWFSTHYGVKDKTLNLRARSTTGESFRSAILIGKQPENSVASMVQEIRDLANMAKVLPSNIEWIERSLVSENGAGQVQHFRLYQTQISNR